MLSTTQKEGEVWDVSRNTLPSKAALRHPSQCRPRGPTEDSLDCLNCQLLAIECLHGFGSPVPTRYKVTAQRVSSVVAVSPNLILRFASGQGNEIINRIKNWTRYPSNRANGPLRLNDIVDPGEPGKGRFTRSVRRVVSSGPSRSHNPSHPHAPLRRQATNMSLPASQPFDPSYSSDPPATPITDTSLTESLSPISALEDSFMLPDSFLGRPHIRSRSTSFLSVNTAYSSAAASSSGSEAPESENTGLSPHAWQQAYSLSTDSSPTSLQPPSTRRHSFPGAMPPYPRAPYSHSEVMSPYLRDGEGNDSLAEGGFDESEVVPEAIADDDVGYMPLGGRDTGIGPIDTTTRTGK